MLHKFCFYSLLDLCIKISSDPVYKESDQSLEITKQQDLLQDVLLPYIQNHSVQRMIIKGEEISKLYRLDVFDLIPKFEINAKNITKIPNYCFSNLLNLNTIVLGTHVKEIGFYCFANTSLISINTESIISIGECAFYKCSKLENIDLTSAQFIGDFAFSESGLTEVNVPNLHSLGYQFYNCSKLTKLEGFDLIPGTRFTDKLDLTSITSLQFDLVTDDFYMRSIVNLTVTGNIQIKNPCPNLETIILTDTHREYLSVKNQPKLKSIIINGQNDHNLFPNNPCLVTIEGSNIINVLEEYAFASCTSLRRIDLPLINVFWDYCFFNCINLEEIGGLLEPRDRDHKVILGNQVFKYCWKFHQIKEYNSDVFQTYAPGLPEVSEFCFAYSGLTTIKFTSWYFSADFDMDSIHFGFSFIGCKNLQSVDLTSVGDLGESYMFKDCVSLPELKFEREIDFIGYYAFENSKINELIIGNKFQINYYYPINFGKYNINENVNFNIIAPSQYDYPDEHFSAYVTPFWNTKITKITFRNYLNSFSLKYFPNSTINEIHCDDSNYFIYEDGILYNNGKTKIFAFLKHGSNSFTIPESVNEIQPFAFACSSLTSLTIPSRITVVDGIFAFCHELKEVTFEGLITKLGDDTFSHCYKLEKINFNGGANLLSIGKYCFCCCYSLSSFPSFENVNSIDEYSFSFCPKLSTFNSQVITEIGAFSFWNSGLQLITANNLQTINENAFNGSMIEEFTCPNDLVLIKKYAFSNCRRLTKFVFNGKITEINILTFFNTSLGRIKIPNNIVSISSHAFVCSFDIEFEFEEGGHPIFDAINNSFFEKDSGILLFTYGKITGAYRIPDKIEYIDPRTLYSERLVTSDGIVIKKGVSVLIIPKSYKGPHRFSDDNADISQDLQTHLSYFCSESEKLFELRQNGVDVIENTELNKDGVCNDSIDQSQKEIVFEAEDGNYPKGVKYADDIYINDAVSVFIEQQKEWEYRYYFPINQKKLDSKISFDIHSNLIQYLFALLFILTVILIALIIIFVSYIKEN